MKQLLQLEEAAQFAFAVWLFYYGMDVPGWVFWALLLAPDLGMLGYLVHTRFGAITYNLLHHKAIAVGLGLSGIWFHSPELQIAGLILFAHASMDRVFGYGLKYSDSFQHTHLGMIGQGKKN